jgi:hypothetical protein
MATNLRNLYLSFTAIFFFTQCNTSNTGQFTKSQLDSALNFKKDSFSRVYRAQLDSLLQLDAIQYADSVKKAPPSSNQRQYPQNKPKPAVTPQADTTLLKEI